MRKLITLALVLMLALPAAAAAEILAPGWQDAPVDQLQAAQQAITSRIAELKTAEIAILDQAIASNEALNHESESVHFEGKGFSMIPINSYPYFPNKSVLSIEKPGKVKLEITGDNINRSTEFIATKDNKVFTFSYDSSSGENKNLTLLVSTDSGWSLDVYPLTYDGDIEFSGSGGSVSNMFKLSAPVLVTIDYNTTAKHDNFGITLVSVTDSGCLYEPVIIEALSKSNKMGSKQAFIKPLYADTCFYVIKADPLTSWSISPLD